MSTRVVDNRGAQILPPEGNVHATLTAWQAHCAANADLRAVSRTTREIAGRVRVLQYADDLLPTLPDLVHGIVGRDPWRIQCDGCGRIAESEHLILAALEIEFNPVVKDDPRRLCRECADRAGWDQS